MNEKSVYIVSLGCSKNLVDTEYLMGEFSRLGYEFASEPELAHTILINTCGFIDPAVREAVDVILELAELKQSGSCGTLIVAGCLVQRYGGELQKELPEVDVFMGPGELDRLGEFLDAGSRDIRAVPGYGLVHNPRPWTGMTRRQATPFYTSYLKISEGCDNRCTFCTIPAIRGPYRSMPPDELVKEARDLAARGVVELNVVAQDITRYGEDLDEQADLSKLLTMLARIQGLRWIRPLYLYPERVTDRILDTIGSEETIVHYFDLPFQHVSPSVLKRMGRGARNFDPLQVIGHIRDKLPDAAIRSTLMVGFPGESEDDFRMLLDFVREARIDHLGVFTYCDEEGTPAARMKDQVLEDVKNERHEQIMTEQAEISRSINRARVGRTLDVLVEGESEETDLLLQGRAAFQAPDIDGLVYISDGRADVGDIVPVEIVQAGDYDLVGQIVDGG